MNTYRIIKDLKLIVHYLSEDISYSIMKEHMTNVIRNPEYSKYYDIITDLRDSNLIVSANEITKFANYVSQELSVRAKRRVVYLTTRPNEAALTMWLSHVTKDSGVDILTCTTEEAALNFISKTGLNKKVFNNLINELSGKTV